MTYHSNGEPGQMDLWNSPVTYMKPTLAESIWRGLPWGLNYKTQDEQRKLLINKWAQKYTPAPQPFIGPRLPEWRSTQPIMTTPSPGSKTVPQPQLPPEGNLADPGTRIIMDFGASNMIPGGLFRKPITLASKLLPKKLVESTAGKLVSKGLDLGIGKIDSSAPPIAHIGKEAVNVAPKAVEKGIPLAKQLNKGQAGGGKPFDPFGKIPEEPLLKPKEIESKFLGQKLVDSIIDNKKQDVLIKDIRTNVRATKVINAHDLALEYEKTMSPSAAIDRANAEALTGKLPVSNSLAKIIPPEKQQGIRDLIVTNLRKKYTGKMLPETLQFHITSTIQAFDASVGNEAKGIVGRGFIATDVGTKGGSAYTRLDDALGSHFAENWQSLADKVKTAEKVGLTNPVGVDNAAARGLGSSGDQLNLFDNNPANYKGNQAPYSSDMPFTPTPETGNFAGQTGDLANPVNTNLGMTDPTALNANPSMDKWQFDKPNQFGQMPDPRLEADKMVSFLEQKMGGIPVEGGRPITGANGELISRPPVEYKGVSDPKFIQRLKSEGYSSVDMKDLRTKLVSGSTLTDTEQKLYTLLKQDQEYRTALGTANPQGLQLPLMGANVPVGQKKLFSTGVSDIGGKEKSIALAVAKSPMYAGEIVRTIISSGDVSYPFRQGLAFGVTEPKIWAQATLNNFKAFGSESFTKKIVNDMMLDPRYSKYIAKGKLMAPVTDLNAGYNRIIEGRPADWLIRFEKTWMAKTFENKGQTIGKIFGTKTGDFVDIAGKRISDYGGILNASQRAAQAFIMTAQYKQVIRDILKVEQITNDIGVRNYFDTLNASLGMAPLPKGAQGIGSFANKMFFSPKLMWSRVSYPVNLWRSMVSTGAGEKVARDQAIKAVIGFTTLGVSLLGMTKAAAQAFPGTVGEPEIDPRSSEFGKIRLGATRLDFWGGYGQYIRFATQFASAQKKVASGQIQDMNRWNTVQKFIQSKDSPSLGFVQDLLMGEDYSGNKMNLSGDSIKQQAYNRLVFLSVQDMADSFNQNGLAMGLVAAPSAMGVGVVTYVDPTLKYKNELAQQKGYQNWDALGLKEGNAAQTIIENSDLKLQAMMEADFKSYSESIAGKGSVNVQWQRQAKTAENTYQTQIQQATAQYRDTGNSKQFKLDVSAAGVERRAAYNNLSNDPQYDVVTNFFNMPLTVSDKAKMNPNDVARHEYNTMMYNADMYDQYGDYNFALAAQRKIDFIRQYGQDALTYVENYQGVKEVKLPQEYQDLKIAQKTLQPFWDITDQVWGQYPIEDKIAADQITVLEDKKTWQEGRKAQQLAKEHPNVIKARMQIAQQQLAMKRQFPEVTAAYQKYYGY